MSDPTENKTPNTIAPTGAPSAPAAATSPLNPTVRAGVLARGESVVAIAGVVGGVLLAAVLGTSAWWTLHTHRASVASSRQTQIETLASTLAPAAETMVAAGELSGLRRLVIDAAQHAKLSTCRIVLPSGEVLADADPKANVVRSLPETWPDDGGSETLKRPEIADGHAGSSLALTIPGRGGARLDVAGAIELPRWSDGDFQLGAGAIAVGGMTGLLLGYHGLRRRMRGLGAIREALAAAERGDDTMASLRVAGDFGVEARAWNTILSDRETLRRNAALRHAEERAAGGALRDDELSSACDAMWQGLVMLGREQTIKYANGAAAVFLGARRDQLVGADIRTLITDPAVRAAIDDAIAGRSRQRATIEASKDVEGGSRSVLRYSVRPVRRDDDGSAVLMVEDVTQQRVADESRNAFVAQTTHELRTPLTNIRLYVETMVEDQSADPAVQTKCLNVISSEVRRLERIVGDMLSVAEIEAGTLKVRKDDVRLDALFDELRDDYLVLAADKEIKLTFDLPPKLPVLQADRDKIAVALHNLIGNAVKYTPAGGTVIIKVAERDGLIFIDVTDNGIGIRPEEQELVFERFYRAKDKRIASVTGSGIGLSLARDVARLHGGDITLRSELDRGSTFTLSLPLDATDTLKKAA